MLDGATKNGMREKPLPPQVLGGGERTLPTALALTQPVWEPSKTNN